MAIDKKLLDKIEADYLSDSSMTLRRLAEKYKGKVSRATLERLATERKWAERRGQIEGKVRADLPALIDAAIAQKKVETAEEWTTETLGLAALMRQQLEGKLTGHQQVIVSTKAGPTVMSLPFINGAKDIKAAIESLDKASSTARKWLGLDKDDGLTAGDKAWDEAMAQVEAEDQAHG